MWRNNYKKNRAYTVIEFALALLIIAIIIGTVKPGVTHLIDEIKAESVSPDLEEISLDIDKYFQENGEYPDSLEQVVNPVPLDPWGNPYEYLRIDGGSIQGQGQLRKDKNLVPINSDYDLYSKGPDGKSASALTANISQDDIVRGRNGAFFGEATEY